MSLKLFLTTLLLSTTARAAEEVAAEGGESIPVKTIVYQAINVGLIIIFFVYKFRKPSKDFFANRLKEYFAKVEESALAKKASEKKYADLQHKANDLEKNFNLTLSTAKADAEALKKRLLADADHQVDRIKKDADTATLLELENQKRKLQARFITQVVNQTHKDLETDLSAELDQKIQSRFINGLQLEMK